MDDQSRVSFKTGKVHPHPEGPTGVTATSRKQSFPTSGLKPKVDEDGNEMYAAEIDFEKLAEKLNIKNVSESEIEEKNDEENIKVSEDWYDYQELEELTEEEVIKNLDQHLGYKPATVDLVQRVDKNGQILPQQVIRSETFNGKTISQNIYIPEPSISERKIIETNTASNKDSFCRNCGSQYLGTDNFCGGCGFKRL